MNLFSSTTSNSEYSLFMSPRDASYINDINTELTEIVANQKFIYWPIDRDNSDVDDIYGEAEKKVTRNPIIVYGWIMIDEPETISNNYTTEVRRRIEVYLHIDRMTEVGIRPSNGDFIEWDNQLFEITQAFVPSFVHGLPEVKVGVTCRCISTRENVINRDPDGEDFDDDVDADSQNPY